MKCIIVHSKQDWNRPGICPLLIGNDGMHAWDLWSIYQQTGLLDLLALPFTIRGGYSVRKHSNPCNRSAFFLIQRISDDPFVLIQNGHQVWSAVKLNHLLLRHHTGAWVKYIEGIKQVILTCSCTTKLCLPDKSCFSYYVHVSCTNMKHLLKLFFASEQDEIWMTASKLQYDKCVFIHI